VLGGLWADAVSDTIQFVLMCMSLAITIPLAVDWVGGWTFLEYLPVRDGDFTSTHLQSDGGLSTWMLVAWATTGLSVLVEPAFCQRVFAAQDERSVKHALLVGILLWAAYDWGVTIIGIIAQAAVQQSLLAGDLEGNAALLTVCTQMLPTGLRGLMIGGILAAAMSTIDTYSLLASGNIVYDIYRPVIDPYASDRRLLLLTRIGVFGVMIAAALISLLFDRMRDTWQFMSSVATSVVFVPMMGALFGRPRPLAGFLAAVAGLAGLIIFYTLLFTQGTYNLNQETYMLQLGDVELWQDYAVLCALPVSCLGYVLGNLMGKRAPSSPPQHGSA
jgi:SSS family solute:Na+ symporter